MLTIQISTSTLLKTALFALALALSACSKPDETASPDDTSQAPQNNDTTAAILPAGKGAPPANQGTVKTVHQGGGYSYIETDINGSSYWIATAITAIKPGDKIAWNDYAIMTSFKSKALNMTFDQILFVDKIRTGNTPVASNTNEGTVVEFMDSAGYTYIHVKTPSENLWLAAPVTKVSVGQSISWSGGAPMQNFSSRSLGRTFDKILFVGSLKTS